jgi:magnesium-transporting ATPase (P-type)
VHSADFAIENLSYIELILRECKCAEQNLIELVLYTAAYYFLYNVYNVFLVHDMSTYPVMPSIWNSFACIYPLALFMAFFKSADKLTKHRPSLNLLGL